MHSNWVEAAISCIGGFCGSWGPAASRRDNLAIRSETHMTFEYLWYYDTLRSPAQMPATCIKMRSLEDEQCPCWGADVAFLAPLILTSFFFLLLVCCFHFLRHPVDSFRTPFLKSIMRGIDFPKFGGLTQISITPLKTNIHYPFKILQEWWLEEISFKLPINFRGVPSDILLDITAKIADSECLKLPKMIKHRRFREQQFVSDWFFPNFVQTSKVWTVIQGQIYSPEGFNGCYRVMFWALWGGSFAEHRGRIVGGT